jgi:hypothetical protein
MLTLKYDIIQLPTLVKTKVPRVNDLLASILTTHQICAILIIRK